MLETRSNFATFVPVFLGRPKLANQSPPLLQMVCGRCVRPLVGAIAQTRSGLTGATAIVSTLLTVVGQPKRPMSAGKGGFKRGLPCLPSNDSISACGAQRSLSGGLKLPPHSPSLPYSPSLPHTRMLQRPGAEKHQNRSLFHMHSCPADLPHKPVLEGMEEEWMNKEMKEEKKRRKKNDDDEEEEKKRRGRRRMNTPL